MQLLHDRATRHGSTTVTSKKFMLHASMSCVTGTAEEAGGTTETEGEKTKKSQDSGRTGLV
jgi:hypothetical protein